MLLAVDVGNSNLTLGLFSGDELAFSFRLSTQPNRTVDEYRVLLAGLFERTLDRHQKIDAAIVASVVPAITGPLSEAIEAIYGTRPKNVGPGFRTGLKISYSPASDVGADRIVNAVAAFAQTGTATIVVDFGTATTFDCISENGTYTGGAIAPGVETSMEALFLKAAKLPRVEICAPKTAIGTNTVASIQSGLFYGYVSMVDGLVRQLKQELAQNARVLATGGLAALFASHSNTIETVDEHLTLNGLRILYVRSIQS